MRSLRGVRLTAYKSRIFKGTVVTFCVKIVFLGFILAQVGGPAKRGQKRAENQLFTKPRKSPQISIIKFQRAFL